VGGCQQTTGRGLARVQDADATPDLARWDRCQAHRGQRIERLLRTGIIRRFEYKMLDRAALDEVAAVRSRPDRPSRAQSRHLACPS